MGVLDFARARESLHINTEPASELSIRPREKERRDELDDADLAADARRKTTNTQRVLSISETSPQSSTGHINPHIKFLFCLSAESKVAQTVHG